MVYLFSRRLEPPLWDPPQRCLNLVRGSARGKIRPSVGAPETVSAIASAASFKRHMLSFKPMRSPRRVWFHVLNKKTGSATYHTHFSVLALRIHVRL